MWNNAESYTKVRTDLKLTENPLIINEPGANHILGWSDGISAFLQTCNPEESPTASSNTGLDITNRTNNENIGLVIIFPI